MALSSFLKDLRLKIKFSRARFFLFFLVFFVLAVFFTPFPNRLAQPLIVASRIEKADAILVLSGGSYDNGQLSSFSLERTIQAVRLYREGLAPKIIFAGRGSSANREDAMAMRQVALSLGIESKDILTESQSSSTYENILFSSRIAKEGNFEKILLVSSPIHLRRALLIAQDVSGEIEFLPASFPSYDFLRTHPLDRLILFWFTAREYLGILREHFRG